MALKPEDGETFLREVDEELRREQTINFFKRYGLWIGLLFVLIVGAVGGTMWWRASQNAAVGTQGDTLVAALTSLEAGNRNGAAPKIAELSNSEIPGYRAAALFARANSQTAANQLPAAIATLRGIAADESLDELYRQAALIRQTQLEYDALPPQQVVQRLRPLAQAGSPWLGTAGEMLGVAYLRLHQNVQAGQVFVLIGHDDHVPSSIRNRVISLASSLGVNAAPAPTHAAGQPPAGAPAAAAPDAATPPANPAANQAAPANQQR